MRYRAADLWCAVIVDGYRFSEVQGTIMGGSPINALNAIKRARDRGVNVKPWEIARVENHLHSSGANDRQTITSEREHLVHIGKVLHKAFPDRRFVLAQQPSCSITFWQDCGEYPDPDRLWREPHEGKAFCQPCQRRQPYIPAETPAPELPQAEWGRCAVCGEDVLVRAKEVLWFVEPEQP